MYTVQCEVHTALGETVLQEIICRTKEDLESTIALIRNCGHTLVKYSRTYEEGR